MLAPLSDDLVTEQLNTQAERPVVIYRLGETKDAEDIARYLQMSSGGLAAYVWSRLSDDHPGLWPRQIGAKLCATEGRGFSFLNCHMALNKNKPVGMMYAYVVGEAQNPLALEGDDIIAPLSMLAEGESDSLFIASLAVDEAMQGQSVGAGIIDVAESRARNLKLKSVSLICFEASARAMAFFRRHDFQERGRTTMVSHDQLHFKGDAVLLAKDL